MLGEKQCARPLLRQGRDAAPVCWASALGGAPPASSAGGARAVGRRVGVSAGDPPLEVQRGHIFTP